MACEQQINWTDQDVLQYWLDPETRGSIINASPLDEQLNVFQEAKKYLGDYTPSLNYTENASLPKPCSGVVSNYVRKHPYHSVGKLFWCKPETRNEIVWVTAFYIGNNKIMTAAHAFDGVEGYAGIFVPAIINREDTAGRNYGSYVIRPQSSRQHPKYKPFQYNNPEYDICTVEVGMGKRQAVEVMMNINVDRKRTEDVTMDGSGLTPIEICVESLGPDFTSCTVLGILGIIDQLLETRGCPYVESESNSSLMAVGFEATKGMSGGPWLVECSDGTIKAIGCTAGTKNLCTLSPRFTRNLFETLEL